MSPVQDPGALDYDTQRIPLDVKTMSVLTSQIKDIDLDDIDFLRPRLLPTTIESEPEHSQLGKQGPQRNTAFEESVPRKIIAASVPVQSEVQRPILSGTFNRQENAYLVILEFHLSTPRESQSWSSRMQGVDIIVTFEDAPNGETGSDDASDDLGSYEDDQEHPIIMETFPGSKGWKGAPAPALVKTKVNFGLGVGLEGMGARTGAIKTCERPKVGHATMVVRLPQSNMMYLSAHENPVLENGVPHHLAIPMIVKHCGRRFQMKVTVKPYFRFWSLTMVERVRALGRTDDPVYFDPMQMETLRLTKRVDLRGVKIIESGGELDELNLEDRSILE